LTCIQQVTDSIAGHLRHLYNGLVHSLPGAIEIKPV